MKIRPSRIRAGAATAVLAMGLAACGGTATNSGGSSGTAGGSVTVGVLSDQTAYLADADGGVLDGVKLAAEAINAAGGVDGKKINVIAEDTASDPQKAVSGVQKLLTQQQAVALIGGFSSAATAAVAPIAAQHKAPMVVASVPAPDPTWTFSTLPPGGFQVATMVDYLKEKQITSVGVLYDTTPYNKLLLGAAKPALAAAGIKLVGAEQHTADAVDMRTQVTKLLGGKPGALLKFSTGPTEIVAAKALAQAGSSIPLLVGLDTVGIAKQATAAYPQVYMVATAPQVYQALPADKRTESLTAFMSKQNSSKDPTYVGRGWDAMYLLANGMKAAGKTDGDAVRQAMGAAAAHPGTSASYAFQNKSHFGIAVNPLYLAGFGGDTPTIVGSPKG